MRILVLAVDSFGCNGGIGLYNRDFIKALCDHPSKIEVVVIPRNVLKPLELLPPRLDFVESAKNSKFSYCNALLRKLFSRPKFDVVICSHLHLLPMGEFVRKIHGSKLALIIYGLESWTKSRGPLTSKIAGKVDILFSIRKFTTEKFLDWSDLNTNKIFTLENAIHLDRYGVGPKNPFLISRYKLGGKKVLLTLSRIDEENFGVDEVLRVFPQLKKIVPNLVYLIAGTGNHLANIMQKVDNLGIGESVIMAGYIDENDKADIYRLGDAFAIPGSDQNLFDRYPIRFSFLEAMACGLPVVASRPEDDIDSSYVGIPNINVNPEDDESLISGILEALDVGPGPVPKVIEQFSFENFSKRLHSVIDEEFYS